MIPSLFRLLPPGRLLTRRFSSLADLPEFLAAKRRLLETYRALTREVETADSQTLAGDLISRWQRLRPIGEQLEALDFVQRSQQETEELLRELAGDDEEDLSELAAVERKEREQEMEAHNEEILRLLVPSETYDECDVVLEISAGAGGQEAMLFAHDLFAMYSRLVAHRGWALLDATESRAEAGGIRFGSMLVSGAGAYRALKYEGGIHRVQRVPRTSGQGKIHTSTAAVAVLPRPDEIEVEVNKSDLKIDTFKSQGKGGQHVNTTDSAVRVTHQPTGVVAECQDTRSQNRNLDIAIERLRIKLQDKMIAEEEAARSASVRLQVGGRNRSEKIRTYNYPQDRLTDHRIGRSWSNLGRLMAESVQLESVLEALQEAARADRLSRTLKEILAGGWE